MGDKFPLSCGKATGFIQEDKSSVWKHAAMLADKRFEVEMKLIAAR